MLIPIDDIAAPFIKRRPPIQDFASESTYRLIKSWLDTCILHHPGCSNSSVISKLPTRVVDVGLPGTRQDPTLFTPPQGYKDSYIALSYCWGNAGSRFVLTKEMADLPRLRFPFDSLPRTLQDAVTITRKLGFRFLWIDALCIIQEGDQGADFLRESATMSAVYGNAALTIAAAGASNVNEGIFRKINTEPDRAAQIPYDLPDGNTGIAFVTFEPVDQGDSRINEPLNTRGWTFQERILSRRVVLFYKDQLSWDCTSTLINSNGPLNPHIRYNQDSPGRYSDYVVSRALTDNSEKTRLKEDSDYWRNLVEFYSRRQLTDTSDKLKAISGLAQLIKSETNDSYLAGLWLSDLRNQLFWHTRDPKEKRQEEYRAPTWSWASVDGQIRFWSQGSINYILGDGYNEPTAIVDYQPDTDEFGIVLRGRLSFKGHLCPFNLELFEERQLTLYEFEKSPSFYGLFFDTSSDKEEFFLKKAKHAHFFFHPEQQAVRRTSELYEVTLAMVLKKVDGTYRRVGIYMKRDGGTLFAPRWAKWLDEWVDVSPETITIE